MQTRRIFFFYRFVTQGCIIDLTQRLAFFARLLQCSWQKANFPERRRRGGFEGSRFDGRSAGRRGYMYVSSGRNAAAPARRGLPRPAPHPAHRPFAARWNHSSTFGRGSVALYSFCEPISPWMPPRQRRRRAADTAVAAPPPRQDTAPQTRGVLLRAERAARLLPARAGIFRRQARPLLDLRRAGEGTQQQQAGQISHPTDPRVPAGADAGR